jgi:hypothetical protein
MQADDEAQQAVLARKKLQDEKQQLAKDLAEAKAAAAPGAARLQQMYGELEVARRQLAEGKLRSTKLQETIQQVGVMSDLCNTYVTPVANLKL